MDLAELAPGMVAADVSRTGVAALFPCTNNLVDTWYPPHLDHLKTCGSEYLSDCEQITRIFGQRGALRKRHN